jgi:catechol 2,3-dioxygenase-like lactoylglutathione lyase family enzyme
MGILKGAHHVGFAVTDVERARQFYSGVLGLEEIERPDFGFPGIWYRVGDVEVHILGPIPGIDRGTPAPTLTPVTNHAAFAIGDYRTTRAHLAAHGIDVVELGEEMGQMFVRDPDGNVIELIRPRTMAGRQ